MAETKRLKLPFISPAQAGKHITHNQSLSITDTLVHLAVLDRDLSAPPAEPEEGDRYIVGPSPSGAWAGKAGQIAAFDGAVWLFHEPGPGWLTYVLDEDGLVVWTGTQWIGSILLNSAVPKLGINALANDTNRLSLKSDAVLLSHDDVTPGSGDMRLTLNKASAGDTVSLVWQTGFSGRAELGTTGDDKLHFKVAPDGSTWSEAIVIDADGRVGVGEAAPVVALDVAGPIRLGSFGVAGLPPADAGAGQLIFVPDETAGATVAFSDGADWRRVADRMVVG